MNYRSKTLINVNGVSKTYKIFKKPLDRLRQPFSNRMLFSEFKALDNISFTINNNETFGIIGENGAGKSTILQLIAGITAPTKGTIVAPNKIASLLELGAGFNPDFTGIENIRLTSSIYGLSNKEIDKKIPLIVNFSGIGKNVNKPVKTFSSGMFVRLAFSVIAHVDADVLIIDEALAVGDAIFVQKCMKFLRNFKKNGTLIFVSHDLDSIKGLCDRVLWLESGRIQYIGDPNEAVEKYKFSYLSKLYELDKNNKHNQNIYFRKKNSVVNYKSKFKLNDNFFNSFGMNSEKIKIHSISIKLNNKKVLSFKGGETVVLTINLSTKVKLDSPIVGFLVKDKLGQDLFGENTAILNLEKNIQFDANDNFQASFEFVMPMLPNGEYSLTVGLANGTQKNNEIYLHLNDVITFTVSSSIVRWGLVGINFSNLELLKLK